MDKATLLGSMASFRLAFWRPPRAHGDVLEDRRVSYLELFYDLVYVVVIAQASHHLALHVSVLGAAQFIVVFCLVWIAWLNGAVYHDLHGRADGRTRAFVFLQMALLALLGVFTENATGADGPEFAVVYSAFLVVLTWLWYSVQRQDDELYRPMTRPYLVGLSVSVAIMVASIVAPAELRTWLWAGLAIGWVVGLFVLNVVLHRDRVAILHASDSIIERFGLLTIIVLGEVVVGVVDGIADSGRTTIAIATGILALGIGFAYWWTYFDFVGGRPVRPGRRAFGLWALGHLPVTMAIAASGAALVGLIGSSENEGTPAAVAWLLAGSVALGLLALVVVMSALEDRSRLGRVYRPLSGALGAAALIALGLGWVRPVPWLFALLLVVELALVWTFAILRWLATVEPTEPIPALHRE